MYNLSLCEYMSIETYIYTYICLYKNRSEKELKSITYEEFVNQNTNTEKSNRKTEQNFNKFFRNDDI